MKRQNYYPGRIGDQPTWLLKLATQLAIYAPNLSISQTDTSACIDDARWCAYVLGLWLATVRAFSPVSTDAVDAVLTGNGNSPVVLPTFNTPSLPNGTAPRNPGALTRIFTMVGRIKKDPAYTEAMGDDLGIIGSEEAATHPTPKFTAEMQQGMGVQVARLAFFKFTHAGVLIEGRRNGGAWEFLGIDTESPYLDERPLLTPGTPEVREYRMRFWDKGTPNGLYTDVATVTISA